MTTTSDKKVNLLDLNQQALKAFFTEMGEKAFRATQVMKWIYHEGVDDFDQMTNLSKALREKLKATCVVQAPPVEVAQISRCGTSKWALRVSGGNLIEAVYIPESDRGTLCVSSQVGCALDCSFCSTARQGFDRNLSVSEIIGQVWRIQQELKTAEIDGAKRITNVVMMGMGEPLLNLDNVIDAMDLMMDDLAYGLSKRRVTVSTSGVVPAMDRLYERIDVALAVSLHAVTDTVRDELVPINKKYPIDELMAACHRYVDMGGRKRHVMFEYVMLDHVNDSEQDAHRLARLLRGLECKVNLIPFNPFPGTGYKCSSKQRVERFWQVLTNKGVLTTIRRTRGEDIDAACGQLAGDVNDRSRRPLRFVEPRFGEK